MIKKYLQLNSNTAIMIVSSFNMQLMFFSNKNKFVSPNGSALQEAFCYIIK